MIQNDTLDSNEAITTMGQRVALIAAISFGGVVLLGLLSAVVTARYVGDAAVSVGGIAA